MKVYELVIGGKSFRVEILEANSSSARVVVNGVSYDVEIVNSQGPQVTRVAAPPKVAPRPAPSAPSRRPAAAPSSASGGGEVKAPMPGLILEVKVEIGSKVKRGEVVARMEAMKMENNILAPVDGVVSEVNVEKGMEVQTGTVLMVIGS